MNCKYHPQAAAIGNCLVCNTPICSDCIANNNQAAPQCKQCVSFESMADLGTREADKAELRRREIARRVKKTLNWLVLQIPLILIAIILVPWQYNRLFGGPEEFIPDKSDTEEMTDLCIANLLKISALLQQDKIPGNEYRCLLSNQPYTIRHTDNDIIVNDPNPERHGFKGISVSKNQPDPLLIE